ncbi:energy transducer TonB [Methylocystis sp. WRRC1]|uniref:energy transducer TonB n=1 Tax=Methylocystis sp. WRRC1 TaxID=1732014 RepID=UPI001D14FB28|nr:energy transducer TonB [Methylocystis sp. WRRC1]MCC3245559.1 energy transducer TonB [Methylocystis sp. WRRC1]
MKIPPRTGLAFACSIAALGAAHAETAKPAAPPAPPAATTASPPAAPAKPATAKPAPTSTAPAAAAKPASPAPAGAMSESKYLSLLYAEIARNTPQDNASGPGEVKASFIVGASGKVEKVTIDKTSSPAHAEIVKKILAGVQTPPPPGGSMDVGQVFRFR